MPQKHDYAAAEPMSPRKLANFEQVAPGRYVTKNGKQELDRYNDWTGLVEKMSRGQFPTPNNLSSLHAEAKYWEDVGRFDKAMHDACEVIYAL